MKLRLPLNRCIGVGLVTLGAGLAREAAEHLSGQDKVSVESVHRARVALKRVRSVLRLLDKAGAAWAIMPRYRLAQLAASMAPARDAAVVRDLAQTLTRRLTGRQRAVALLLAAKKRRVPRWDAAQIRQALLQESSELAAAPPPVISPPEMRALLRQTLKRAGRRFSAALSDPSAETVHEWRKAVIVLRDQTALAARRWPSGAGAANPLLVRFARRLGRRGDLALLGCRLQSLRVAPAHRPARRTLLARLEAQREEAMLRALLSWPKLEWRLTRLLSEQNPAGRQG